MFRRNRVLTLAFSRNLNVRRRQKALRNFWYRIVLNWDSDTLGLSYCVKETAKGRSNMMHLYGKLIYLKLLR